MSLSKDFKSSVKAARKAGRDVPTVIEELFQMLVDTIDPPEKVQEEAPAPDAKDEKSKDSE